MSRIVTSPAYPQQSETYLLTVVINLLLIVLAEFYILFTDIISPRKNIFQLKYLIVN